MAVRSAQTGLYFPVLCRMPAAPEPLAVGSVKAIDRRTACGCSASDRRAVQYTLGGFCGIHAAVGWWRRLGVPEGQAHGADVLGPLP